MLTDISEYQRKIKRVLITEDELKAKIAESAAAMSREYEGKPLLLVSILNGAYVFMADYARALSIPAEISFMVAKSYQGTESTGNVRITKDIEQDISQYHVVILEDIVDTGRTLSLVIEKLKERNPLSLKVVTLLDKPERRVVDFKPEEALFTIPDLFVIGYGLDYDEAFRNLPYIAEYNVD